MIDRCLKCVGCVRFAGGSSTKYVPLLSFATSMVSQALPLSDALVLREFQ